MKQLITMICLMLLANCVKMEKSDTNNNFIEILKKNKQTIFSNYNH